MTSSLRPDLVPTSSRTKPNPTSSPRPSPSRGTRTRDEVLGRLHSGDLVLGRGRPAERAAARLRGLAAERDALGDLEPEHLFEVAA